MKTNSFLALKWCLYGALLLSLGMTGCHSDSDKDTQTAEATPVDSNLLAGATIDTARLKPITNELQLTGKVTFNQDKVVKVFSLVGGRIENVKADLGAHVQKGQTLAVISSGDLADLHQEAIAAQGQLALAQKNMQVAEDMVQAGLSSQKDLVAARGQLSAAKGEVDRVNERRRIMGGSGASYIVKAPISGFIVEKTAASGMELRSDDPETLFTISNLDQVWVMANVYEADLSNINEGDEATITTIAYPDQVYKGRIDKVFNVLDPDSKTMKVRITLLNADFKLKPEMFANVIVSYPGQGERIAIPGNALVFDKSRNFVVVVNRQNQPVVREVTIFKTIGDTVYLNSGLQAGDRIVTKNQLLIYNALDN
ncbi:efflux RND transporter periplasmic adaptor subunit [Siphonobacter curvatus]|uniref:Efflux RND transporter periplasmic adaptor subunit n=2 Tax=Siphonobacter TaxID=700450 RepID=A0A2S7IG75_9BACT|nr:efflux RND transporter periplasmic adaptor subunit [Siphonobacter curvatus]PQA54405.1 efflux RND transporter periplasmic adaptor subunit [Siphonobacter curvatus]